MGFLKNILGRGKSSAEGPADPVARAPDAKDPASDPNLIRVYDSYGRELFITREQWRDKVLPGTLEKAKANPDELSGLIVTALRDGFAQEVVPFAEQLSRCDTQPARGATLLGVVYLQLGRTADAERVLKEYLARHGEDPYVLVNLAKAQDARGDHPLAEATLWRALELDPNQDAGFGWYLALHRERNGERGYLEACRRLASLPGSWRAQLWLARDALKGGDLAVASSLYRESLSRAGEPAPGELLMQLSGDLGKSGHLEEIVSMVAPKFSPPHHGLEVGNNLIKANLELGRLEAAKEIIDQLYALDRPDWRPHLEFWDAEVNKARVRGASTPSRQDVSIALVSVEGPLWLRDGSPCAALMGAKPEAAPQIAFFGSTALMANETDSPRLQLADRPGRLSRVLPLVMAEQVHLTTDAVGVSLIPWVEGQGFALFGRPYEDRELLSFGAKGSPPPTFLASLVVDARGSEWRVSLRLLRVADGTCVGTAEALASATDPAPAVERLNRELMLLLRGAGIGSRAAPSWYRRPVGTWGSSYLLCLEQQLAVTCDALHSLGSLSGEHQIIEGAIRLSVETPDNATTRMLFAQTLRQMKKVRPELLPQYRARIDHLQREHPVTGIEGDCISRAIEDAFAA